MSPRKRSFSVGRNYLMTATMAWCALIIVLLAGTACGSPLHDLPFERLQEQCLSGEPEVAAEAVEELSRRFKQDQLTEAQIESSLDGVLDRQKDDKANWNPAWGRYFELVARAGKVDGPRLEKYVGQGVLMEIRVAPFVVRGEPLPLLLVLPPQRVSDHDFPEQMPAMKMENVTWRVGVTGAGGRPARAQFISGTTLSALKGQAVTEVAVEFDPSRVARDVPDGPLRLTIDMAGDVKWNDPPGDGRVLAKFARRFDVETRIGAEAAAPVIEFDKREELLPDMRRTIRPSVRVRAGGDWVALKVEFDNQPADIAYDVTLRAGEKTWPAGRLIKRAGQTVFQELLSPKAQLPTDAETVDVLMTPSTSAARRTVETLRPFAFPLAYPGLPIERLPAKR